jgi:ABC-type antimicrobial peptide transport system permease subunit
MAIPLLEGRQLNDRDRAAGPPVAVISKALADRYWPGQSAVGRKMRRFSQGDATLVEIVGVVGDVKDAGAGLPSSETVYVPFDQVSLRRGWIVLHGPGPTADLLAAGRRALRATAPDVAAYGAATLDELAAQANGLPRLLMILLGVFATLAIGITALGSYGVMSQLVSNREKEIAIRAALGATRPGVLRLVLWQNARLAIAGVVAGLVGAWFMARWLATLVPGLGARTAWPYLVVASGVLFITQIASSIPARRAANLDAQKVLTGT